MLRRLAAVLVPAAVAVPLLAAPASASCRSDLMARDLDEGFQNAPGYSPHWPAGYVTVTGTATVTVHGDALANDVTLFAGDVVVFTQIVAANTADATTDFAICVAG